MVWESDVGRVGNLCCAPDWNKCHRMGTQLADTGSRGGSPLKLDRLDTLLLAGRQGAGVLAECGVCVCVCVRVHDKRTSRHLLNIHKAKQHNSTTSEEDFFQRKISCLRWDSNPRHSAL